MPIWFKNKTIKDHFRELIGANKRRKVKRGSCWTCFEIPRNILPYGVFDPLKQGQARMASGPGPAKRIHFLSHRPSSPRRRSGAVILAPWMGNSESFLLKMRALTIKLWGNYHMYFGASLFPLTRLWGFFLYHTQQSPTLQVRLSAWPFCLGQIYVWYISTVYLGLYLTMKERVKHWKVIESQIIYKLLYTTLL